MTSWAGVSQGMAIGERAMTGSHGTILKGAVHRANGKRERNGNWGPGRLKAREREREEEVRRRLRDVLRSYIDILRVGRVS